MALTIIPAVWEDFIVNLMPQANNAINQGLTKIIEDPSIRDKDTSWRRPYLKSLDSVSTGTTRVTTSTTVTYAALNDYSEVFPIVHGYGAIAQHDLNTITQGIDAMQLIAPQIAEKNLKDIQGMLKYMTDGIYGTSGVLEATHVKDYSSVAITPEHIDEAAEWALGENWEKCDKIYLHTTVKRALQDDIKGHLTTLANGQTVLREYLGQYQIITNNTICAPVGGVYKTWIAGGNPFTIGYQRALALEASRNAATFEDRLQWTYHIGFGLDGVSMTTDNNNPSDAELQDVANYTKVAEQDRNILLVQLKTLV